MSYNNGEDPFSDLSNFRPLPGTYTLPEEDPFTATTLAPEQPTAAKRGRAKRTKAKVELLKFVQAPIPWKQRLIGTRGSTYDLALELLAESWLTGKNTVVVSNILAERVSLSRDAKWRALQQLEERGLIRLERETKKAGRATLLLSEKSDNLSEN
jgi:hypothetical protein